MYVVEGNIAGMYVVEGNISDIYYVVEGNMSMRCMLLREILLACML